MADALDLLIARGPQQVDFSGITNLPESFSKGQQMGADYRTRQSLKGGLPRTADGQIDFAAAADMIAKAGNTQGALDIAKTAASAGNQAFDQNYKTQMLDIYRQKAGKESQPAIVQQAVAGGLKPGTPEYNEYILRSGRPPQTAKPLAQNTVNALGEAGEGVTNFGRLVSTWSPNFGGKGMAWIGELQNAAGRNLPPVTDNLRNNADQAAWWQDYQEQKNIIRNKLFGSALTATEKGEFEKASINPGMQPDQIKKNLDRQQAAAKRAATKMASYYVKAGYQPDQIEAALGVPLAELGIRGAQTTSAGASPPQAGATQAEQTRTIGGKTYFMQNGQWFEQ